MNSKYSLLISAFYAQMSPSMTIEIFNSDLLLNYRLQIKTNKYKGKNVFFFSTLFSVI